MLVQKRLPLSMFSPWNDYENYLKICCLIYNMSKIGTKYPPEKLEYWRQYRRDNAGKCRNQRHQWREQNRDRIRLCARRSYYRKLLHEGHDDASRIQAIISHLDDQIAAILECDSQ